jgi:cation diffusion facilitator family transporter
MAERRLLLPLVLSIVAALSSLALKYFAYALTGSMGLLSEAAESIVNVVTAVTALIALIYASRPVDRSHTYGHEKIEFFSSGLEGILIVAAALGVAWYAIRRLLAPQPLEALDLGILVSLAATLLNLGTARYLLRVGRAHRSIVLEADGKHLMADVWTSSAVIAGLVLVRLTGIHALDSAIALIVATSILWTGFDLVRLSFNGLMDHALTMDEQTAVRAAIASRLEDGMDYHALRTRQAGAHRFADFHLLVPGTMSVKQAHAVGTRIEEAVQAALPDIEVTIHIEPIEEQAAWQDSALLEIEREERRAAEQGDQPETNAPSS